MAAKRETCASGTGTEGKEPSAVGQLNDAFRTTCRGGTLAVTGGVIALGRGALPAILDEVRAFKAFSADNDPYGEHDFGSLEWRGTRIF